MKKLRVLGLTALTVIGLSSAAISQAAASSVTYTIKNNSSSAIALKSTSCQATGMSFPNGIEAKASARVDNDSIYPTLYSCQVEYRSSASSSKSCKFTISRFMSGNSWLYPTVYLTSGSSSYCNGRVTSAYADGDFSVELNHNF
ncbi:hypothetical protein [Bartonella apihabitans]|uniref:hypothetical protein n=1 Tax=Bartonella apihabitans TaxID=2750929 RepID=UPI003BB6F940